MRELFATQLAVISGMLIVLLAVLFAMLSMSQSGERYTLSIGSGNPVAAHEEQGYWPGL